MFTTKIGRIQKNIEKDNLIKNKNPDHVGK